MLKELVKEYSIKSKLILLFSIIVIIITLFKINDECKSRYKINDTYIEGIIEEKKVYENRISLIIKGKEKVLLNCYDCKNEFILGTKINAKGEFKIPNNNTVFYLFNYRNYLKSKKINYIFSIKSYTLENTENIFYKIKNKIINRINTFNNLYMNTFILGNNLLEEDIYKIYQNNGISHLFALSGMHISLLTMILINILKKIIKNKFIIYITIFIFLIFFMFLTNFSPSILRSSFLFIGISLNKFLKLNLKTIDILLIILDVLLLYNPFYVYSISFIFSFTISFYLILFNKIFNQFKNYFVKIFLVSLVAFIVSIPIVINSFSTINLMSPLINLISVPIISIIIFPLSLLVFVFPFLNSILLFLINKFEMLSFLLSKISINLDFGYMNIIMVLIYYFIITNILIKPKINKIISLIVYLIILYNFNYFKITPSVTFIDVKQGDSILLELPFNKGNILIDTGGSNYDLSSNVIEPFLKRKGIKKLEFLIITHGDFDHEGNAINLVNNFEIENVIFNCGEFNELEKELISVLNKKKIKYYSCVKELNVNGSKLYFLSNKDYGNENDNSIVLYTEINNKKFLFMGDASVKTEKDIMNKYNLKDIDAIKVGHHGSKTSSSKEFIDMVNPKYSVISVGKNNRYGHPNNEVLEVLDKTQIYRTDIDGSIMFKLKNNKLDISTRPP